MSLGIDDPVTRDAYRSSNEYFRQLAKQLAYILEEPIKVSDFNIRRTMESELSMLYAISGSRRHDDAHRRLLSCK